MYITCTVLTWVIYEYWNNFWKNHLYEVDKRTRKMEFEIKQINKSNEISTENILNEKNKISTNKYLIVNKKKWKKLFDEVLVIVIWHSNVVILRCSYNFSYFSKVFCQPQNISMTTFTLQTHFRDSHWITIIKVLFDKKILVHDFEQLGSSLRNEYQI